MKVYSAVNNLLYVDKGMHIYGLTAGRVNTQILAVFNEPFESEIITNKSLGI